MLDVARSFWNAHPMPARTVSASPDQWRSISRLIVSRREALGWQQKDLVEASGVSQSVISKLENGRPDNDRVTGSRLRKIATALRLWPGALEEVALGISTPEAALAQAVDHNLDLDGFGGRDFWYGQTAEELRPAVAQWLAMLDARVAAIEEQLGISGEDSLEARRTEQAQFADALDQQFALAAEGGTPEEVGPAQHRPSPEPEPEGP